MAHKTLIGGTTYEVSGGKTLVNGTAYSIKSGKTLVGGTAYEVGFVSFVPIVNFGVGTFTYTQGLGMAFYNRYIQYDDSFPIGLENANAIMIDGEIFHLPYTRDNTSGANIRTNLDISEAIIINPQKTGDIVVSWVTGSSSNKRLNVNTFDDYGTCDVSIGTI